MRPLEELDHDEEYLHKPITMGEFEDRKKQKKADLGNKNWEKFAKKHKHKGSDFAP
jgi:hypothetical protein